MSQRRVDELISQADALGVELDGFRGERLLAYERLLLDRAIPAGFVASSDAPRLRTRHLLDCLRAAAILGPADRDAVDLGAGAGLPGVVLAVACPRVSFRLLEPRRRRAAFLELAVEQLGLTNARVLSDRAEDLAWAVRAGREPPADVCFARALAALDRCVELARPLLRRGGRLVWFAGRGWAPRAGAVPGPRTVETPGLESAGPLVIMGPQ